MTTQKRRSSTLEHGTEGGVQDEMEASGGGGALARQRLDKDEGVGVEILARQELAILMEMAKPYLENVETKVVLRRLVHSLVPMHRPTVALIADPDLYGPIVLTATKALLLQAAGFSVLGGILVAIFYWVGLSGGLYLVSRRILHEYRTISGGLGVDPALQELDEEQGGASLDEGQRDDGVAASDHDDDGDKGRHVYLRPLRLDQLFCVCGYGVFSHCLLLGLTPTSGGGVFLVLCKLSVLLSSSACIALVVFRSMSVLANAQTATALGAGVIVLHGLIWPALLGLLP